MVFLLAAVVRLIERMDMPSTIIPRISARSFVVSLFIVRNWLIGRIASVVWQLPRASNARLAVSFNDWQVTQALRLAIERKSDEAARVARGLIIDPEAAAHRSRLTESLLDRFGP